MCVLLAQIFITVGRMSVCHEVFAAVDGVVCMDFGHFFVLAESLLVCADCIVHSEYEPHSINDPVYV